MAAMAAKLTDWVREKLPEVTVTAQPIVVFIDPRVQLQITDPAVPLRVNGQRMWGGLHVLQHKDEFQVGADRYWYSAVMQPHVTRFAKPADADTHKCPMCRVPLEAGDVVVSCPGCGRSYHQSEAKQCWTYREQCKFCGHPTALTGEPAWRPEMEEADD